MNSSLKTELFKTWCECEGSCAEDFDEWFDKKYPEKDEYDKLKEERDLLIEALQNLYSAIDNQILNYRFGDELGKAKELLNNLKK